MSAEDPPDPEAFKIYFYVYEVLTWNLNNQLSYLVSLSFSIGTNKLVSIRSTQFITFPAVFLQSKSQFWVKTERKWEWAKELQPQKCEPICPSIHLFPATSPHHKIYKFHKSTQGISLGWGFLLNPPWFCSSKQNQWKTAEAKHSLSVGQIRVWEQQISLATFTTSLPTNLVNVLLLIWFLWEAFLIALKWFRSTSPVTTCEDLSCRVLSKNFKL